MLALCLGTRHAGLDPLGDQRPLELRQTGHDAEDELALRGRGIGVLAIADEIYAKRPELLEGIDQLLHGARETIVPPDHLRAASSIR